MKVTLSDGSVAYLPGAGHVDFFASESVPDGYLVANGAAVSRATYPELFAAIGTVFGTGDGSTTFNLPNLTGKFIRGNGGNAGTFGAAQAEGLPDLLGGMPNTLNVRNSSYTDGIVAMTLSSQLNITSTSGTNNGILDVSLKASRNNSIYGASNHVTPENVALLPCIKY